MHTLSQTLVGVIKAQKALGFSLLFDLNGMVWGHIKILWTILCIYPNNHLCSFTVDVKLAWVGKKRKIDLWHQRRHHNFHEWYVWLKRRSGEQGILHISLSHTEPCHCTPLDLTLSLHTNSKYCSLAVRRNSKPWCFWAYTGPSRTVCVCMCLCMCVCMWERGRETY